MSRGILVSLFDSKAETWSPPSCADSKAAAIRQFEMLVNDRQQTLVSTHPEDFTLFMLGDFDGVMLKACDKIALANGIDVKRPGVKDGVNLEPVTRVIPGSAK